MFHVAGSSGTEHVITVSTHQRKASVGVDDTFQKPGGSHCAGLGGECLGEYHDSLPYFTTQITAELLQS